MAASIGNYTQKLIKLVNYMIICVTYIINHLKIDTRGSAKGQNKGSLLPEQYKIFNPRGALDLG